MKRHKMALLMWQHGEEALAKALVGCKLYKAMAHEAAEDDMETEVYEELRSYGKEFENIALEVLDYCYRQDDDQTQQLLTCELQNWSGQTCLSLAVAANHRALLAHPCSQIILADLWMGGLRTRKNTNLKVIMGLLFAPYILKLEFKSKEELQLMPQTTEEHMELENDDDDKSDSDKTIDGEVSKRTRSLSIRSKSANPQGVKALLTENFIRRETVVQENGKVMSDLEDNKYHIFSTDIYQERIPRNRELKMSKKLYEFYTAPITKFWANSVAYLIFLIIFSYTILVKMDETPTWQEWLAISFLCTFGCEKLRELFSSEPVGIKQKLAVWCWNLWNPCDMAAVLFFLIGAALRFKQSTFEVGRVFYCINSIYWYLHILNILSVNKYLGPLVTMMGKMVKNMIYFVVLLLIVLMSFGVSRQAILFPNHEPNWGIARDVFLEPYFMLYGEVYADKIDPSCGGEGEKPCQTGRWVAPVIMSVYLLVANILLINLLIAVFNNIFNEVNAIAHQVWMFQRFTVVMEYEQKPLLPPPFIIFCHIYLLFKYLRRKMEGKEESYDNGLKLFLDRDEMERLYDFEEDCVEGYFAEQEFKLQQSTEERIKVTTERIEHLTQKVEDIHTKENIHTTALQNLEIRCRRLVEQLQDVSTDMEKIRTSVESQASTTAAAPTFDVTFVRERTISEPSEIIPDDIPFTKTGPPATKRRPIVRSLTEVRPDAYIFDNGQHIEYRYDEEDECNEEVDAIPKSESQQPLTFERQRTKSTDSKTSNDSGEISADDLGALSLEVLRNWTIQKRKDSTGTGRRSSDGGNACEKLPQHLSQQSLYFHHYFRKEGDDSTHGSKRSLNKRQLSQTQSEPETSDPPATATNPVRPMMMERSVTFTEPTIKVIPPTIAGGSNRTALLMHMHTEYTSITDELESVCGLLSPPRSPGLLSPPRPEQSPPSQRKRAQSEMSNPEMAINLEKEHLRSAEECDYMVMENLIQRRYDDEETDHGPINPDLLSVVTETREYRITPVGARPLRRASAIEGDVQIPQGSSSDSTQQDSTDRQDSTESNDIAAALLNQPPMPQRPSIVLDSSQLPIQREMQKADSTNSLHMQSETMC
jgi:transient receptor potential cation channel subfamily M protein 3